MLSERTKKILFAIGFVSFSFGMGFILYIIVFRTPTATTPPTTETPPNYAGELPNAGAGTTTGSNLPSGIGELPNASTTPGAQQATEQQNIQVLREGVTQAVSPSTDGNGARFYNPEDGRFYRVNPDGSITVLSQKQFYNLEKVNWGKKDDMAVLEFPDGQNVFYDFKQEKQVTLPKHWEEFDFAPQDDRLASKSIGTDTDNRFLITSNPDGTEAKAIESLGDNADLAHVSWSPNGQIIAYSMTGSPQAGSQQEVFMIGQNHENFNSIISPGQGFLPSWSPSGKTILFSAWNSDTNNQPNLWLVSGESASLGNNRRNLNLHTWSDKCTWAGDNDVYCAVPQNLPNNAALSRDDFATLPDDVFHVNLKTGSIAKVLVRGDAITVRNPVVNRDQSKLMFTDGVTGKLLSLDLK